jgi:hypothetical protein
VFVGVLEFHAADGRDDVDPPGALCRSERRAPLMKSSSVNVWSGRRTTLTRGRPPGSSGMVDPNVDVAEPEVA